jgi:hypothetical protein
LQAFNNTFDAKTGAVKHALDVIVTDTGRVFVDGVHSDNWVVLGTSESRAAGGAATQPSSHRALQPGDEIVAVGNVRVCDAAPCVRKLGIGKGGSAAATGSATPSAAATASAVPAWTRRPVTAKQALQVCRSVGDLFWRADPTVVALSVVPFGRWECDDSMRVPSDAQRAEGAAMQCLRESALAVVRVDDAVSASLSEKGAQVQSSFRGTVYADSAKLLSALAFSGGLVSFRDHDDTATKKAKVRAAVQPSVSVAEEVAQVRLPLRAASRKRMAPARAVSGDVGGLGAAADAADAAAAVCGDEEGPSGSSDVGGALLTAASNAVPVGDGVPTTCSRSSKRIRVANVLLAPFDVNYTAHAQ